MAIENDRHFYILNTKGLIGVRMYGSMYKVVRDISGSVRYLVDIEGRIAAQYKYDAHGVCKVYDGKNAVNTSSTFIGNKFPIRWKGYYYDTETGLYYNRGRYYDPEIGKYLDACGVEEAIAEEQLDRNGIMCDNILELMPYICSVLIGLTKDPTSGESDSATNGWNMPWWAWLIFGGVILVGLGVATAITGGSAAGVAGYILSGAFKGAVTGALSSSIIGGVIGGLSSLVGGDGFMSGFVDGALAGFATGALIGGVTGAIRSAIQVVNAAKYWDKGTYKSAFQSMKDHYQRKIVQYGLNHGTNIVEYTHNAVGFASHNARVLSLIPNYKGLQYAWTLNTKYFGYGCNGLYTAFGKIITFGMW